MPEPGAEPAKPRRPWPQVALWTAAILAGLGLFWLAGRGLRLYQTHRIVAQKGFPAAEMVIVQLGGKERAAVRLAEYARLPDKLLGDEELRWMAFYYLWHCGQPGLRSVFDGMDDDNGNVCQAAYKARMAGLGLIPAVSQDLAALLSDRSAAVRFRAAETFGWAGPGGRPILPSLLAAAGDPVPCVRGAALEAIGSIGTLEQAAPVLEAALKDPDAQVRAAAAEALKRMRAEEPPK